MNDDLLLEIRTVFENISISSSRANSNILSYTWGENNVSGDFFKLYYITDGNAEIEVFDTKYHLEKGSLILVPANTPAHYIANTINNLNRYWCSFTLNLKSRLLKFNKDNIYTQCDSKVILPIWKNLLNHSNDDSINSIFKRKILTLELLSIFFNSFEVDKFIFPNKSQFYSTVNSYINSHIKEEIHVKDLLLHTNLEHSYFCKKFKSYFLSTPNKYINMLKLENCADDLLSDNSKSIEEVARQNGFTDYRYFTRIFKKMYSQSPSNYKKTNRKSPHLNQI